MKTFQPKLFQLSKQYTASKLIGDIVAGIIVAIIALPLSIALAIASGVSPEQGLYTAIIAGFVIAFLGGSNVNISGPTAAFATIVAGIVATHGLSGLIVATILAGILLILMGVCRFGSLIKYIPMTITTGFTAGIAVTIVVGQVKDFLGLTFAPGTHAIETGEKDDAAHLRVINTPPRAIGKTSVENVLARVRSGEGTFWQMLVAEASGVSRSAPKLKGFVDLVQSWKELVAAGETPLPLLAERIVNDVAYKEFCDNTHAAEKKDGPGPYDDKTEHFVCIKNQQAVITRYESQDEVPTISFDMNVARIGDIAIASNPFELYLYYGQNIKARSKAFQTFLVQLSGNANFHAGYLPSPDGEKFGGYGGLIINGQVGSDGGYKLADITVEEINKLFEE